MIQSFTLERYKTSMKEIFLQMSQNGHGNVSCLATDPHENEPFGSMLRKLLYKDLIEVDSKETVNNLMYEKIKQNIPKQFPKEFSTTERLYGNKEEVNLEFQEQEQLQGIFEGDILLFEDDKLINSYNDKLSFFKFYESKNRQIEKLQKELIDLSSLELKRIIKEFDFRNYEQNYKATCSHILCILWGVETAINELVRNQMLKNKNASQQS